MVEGHRLAAVVINAAPFGLALEMAEPPAMGARIGVLLAPHGAPRVARVVWARAGRCGVKLAQPLTAAEWALLVPEAVETKQLSLGLRRFD